MTLHNLNLTDKEIKYLLKFEKDVENMLVRYSIGILFLCIAVVGLFLFFLKQNNDGFFMAIFFGTLGSVFIVVSRVYKKLNTIIQKMKIYIKELENRQTVETDKTRFSD